MSGKKSNVTREPFFHLSKRAGISPLKAWEIRLLAVALGFVTCGLVAFLLIEKLQENPGKIGQFYGGFIQGAFGKGKFWKYLKDTAVLLSISLALVPAFRMRFWNIGGEGQTLVSILGAIAVNIYLGGRIPEWLLLILMFIGSVLSGALWGFIPAFFRAKWGTNETLFTLMMNYVATFLVGYCLVIWVPNGSSSLQKMETGRLPGVGDNYLPIILTVLAMTILLFIYLKYTKHGYEVSVVGESVRTARYVGINERRVIIRTMILSGALCGLAGYLIAAGLDHTITANSVGGRGFTGIMVAWLGKFNPIGMILTAALVQLLNQGAAQISRDFNVRGALPEVFVGIILFFVIASEFFINYQVRFRGQKKANRARMEGVK